MLNMNLNKDRARILGRRRYDVAVPGCVGVRISPLGVYIQLDAKDQLKMLKMKPSEEIDLRGEGGGVIQLRRVK